jgi:hypothetical protein
MRESTGAEGVETVEEETTGEGAVAEAEVEVEAPTVVDASVLTEGMFRT